MSNKTTKYPTYLPWLTALTVVYLTTELAFNARLLDVVGGLPDQDAVDHIEHWGRFLSGTALTLAIWGMLLFPHGPRWLAALSERCPRLDGMRLAVAVGGLAVSAVLCQGIAWYGERALIDGIVNKSDAGMRRNALHLGVVANGLRSGDVRLKDSGVTDPASPDWRTTVAVFPALAMSDDAAARAAGSVIAVVRRAVESKAGGFDKWNTDAWQQSLREVKRQYLDYHSGVERYHAVLAGIDAQLDAAWSSYTRQVVKSSGGVTVWNLPPAKWGEVVAQLHRQGVMVPNDFRPSDTATFRAAAKLTTMAQAEKEYVAAMTTSLGFVIPDDLDFAGFANHPAVAIKWGEALHLPAGVLPSTKSDPQALYDATIDSITSSKLDDFRAPVGEFADGAVREPQGKTAVTALVVPVIALAFSLLGALFHAGKLTLCLARFAMPKTAARLAGLGVVVAGLLLAWVASTPVTTSGFFLEKASKNPTVGVVAKWSAQAQVYAYPLNECVRSTLGWTFGVRT